MPMKALRILNPVNALGLFAVAVLTLTTGLFFIFDLYLKSVGSEIVGSWLQSEAVTIQEGNLLSSISKNQRVLLSSQFVKGVRLVDTSSIDAGSLIEFGESFRASVPGDLKPGVISSRPDGFLVRQVFYRVAERPDLVLIFHTQSDFLTRIFLAAVSAFILFLTFLFVSIRRVESRRIAAENRNRILLGDVAARVAHDIRSPLNTLNAVMDATEDLSPESRRLLSTAIHRIREIASGIADQSRLALKENTRLPDIKSQPTEKTEATLLFTLIQELIDEKRVQYGERAASIRWQPSNTAHSAFSSVNPCEFKRSLSNLIDNAIEASAPETGVTVSMRAIQNDVVIEITDQGRGISKKDLPRIGEKGFSRGKANGSGLGVFYAKKSFEAWGGRLSIQSEEGKGTTVLVRLPEVPAPEWYTGSVSLAGTRTVVLVDDDPTVHAMWQDRLKHEDPEVMIEHFFDPESAMSWVVQNRRSLDKCLLLTDFNLNSQAGDGIAVLERFGVAHPRAVMVTSAFEDPSVRDRCEKLNVKILPKPVMNFAAIEVG